MKGFKLKLAIHARLSCVPLLLCGPQADLWPWILQTVSGLFSLMRV